MQSPPQWNAPPISRSPNGTTVVLIILGVFAVVVILCCAGGGLFFMRLGGSDMFACSDLTMKGEYKKAIPACRSEVAKIPRSADGHNNLAWCLTLDGQLPEGVVEARKAVELLPQRNHYDTLAMALALSGQSTEAMQIETEHVMINGQVANASEHVTLGAVYYSSGRKEEAHRQWEIARTSTDVQAQKLATEFEAKFP